VRGKAKRIFERFTLEHLKMPHRMLKKAAQQGRSERRGDAYSVRYVEPLSEVRTPLADFFSILLGRRIPQQRESNKAKLLVPHRTIE
jgi:hypothetical protein